MSFVRFNWGFILKVDMRRELCKTLKTKKVSISQAAVRFSLKHDSATSRGIETSPTSFFTSPGPQCHFHPHLSKVDRTRCKHHRYMPATWFLRNHLLACTKTHFRGQECMSTKHRRNIDIDDVNIKTVRNPQGFIWKFEKRWCSMSKWMPTRRL